MPKEVFFQVVINGSVCSADLETLRQWVRDGRVGPNTVATRDDGPPFPLRHLSELREEFQATIPLPPGPFRAAAQPSPISSATAVPPRPSAPLTLPSFQAETRSEAREAIPNSVYQGDFPNEQHRKDPRYKAAMKYIRRASWTGMILSAVLFLGGLLSLTAPQDRLPEGPWGFHIGVVYLVFSSVFFLLNRGLHFGNRLCAALLLMWFGWGLVQNVFLQPNLIGAIISGGVFLLFLGAAVGSVELHQFRKEVERGNF